MMGVIQEKYTLADVICQHKTDGSIIPLKIRITDEDGEYQVYNIKSYKDVSNRTAYTMPNGTSVAPANHLWKFECKISVFRFSFFIMPMKTVGRCSIHRTLNVPFFQLVLLTFSLTNWN